MKSTESPSTMSSGSPGIVYVDGSPKGRVGIVFPGNSPPEESSVVSIGMDHTNNEAEYLAVLKGLEAINKRDPLRQWIMYSDSKLTVMQVKGVWVCRAPNLLPILHDIWDYLETHRLSVEFKWISRNHNFAGHLLDHVLSLEHQVNKEIKAESNGKIRPYAKRLFRESGLLS